MILGSIRFSNLKLLDTYYLGEFMKLAKTVVAALYVSLASSAFAGDIRNYPDEPKIQRQSDDNSDLSCGSANKVASRLFRQIYGVPASAVKVTINSVVKKKNSKDIYAYVVVTTPGARCTIDFIAKDAYCPWITDSLDCENVPFTVEETKKAESDAAYREQLAKGLDVDVHKMCVDLFAGNIPKSMKDVCKEKSETK